MVGDCYRTFAVQHDRLELRRGAGTMVSRSLPVARGAWRRTCWEPGKTADSRAVRGWRGEGGERHHGLAEREQIYWQDLRREIFVVPSGGLGPLFENLIASRLTEQGRRPNIIVQDTSLESVLSIVAAKRYISIATGASQGVAWSDLRFQEIHDPTGPARLEYALYWREDNDNPALQRFFKLIEERYPG